MTRIYENQQQIVNNVRDVVGEVENQFTMNNNRNNQQEDMLKALGGAIIGLEEEFEKGRTNNQILQENQVKMEQRIEEERRVTNDAMQRNTISIQNQEDILQEWIRREQANGYRNPNTEPKRGEKRENAPPGLTYGVAEQRYFDQREREKRPNL